MAGIATVAFWFQHRSPQPPVVPLDALDRSLAAVVESARSNVLQSSKSAVAWGRLGEALQAAEFNAPARFCYSNAVVLDPNSYRWVYLLSLLELEHDAERGIQHLKRATDLATGQSDSPRLQLSRALVERGRYEEAEPHLRTLLASNPNHAAAAVELARVHLARHALKEATQALQPALTNSFTMRPALLIAAQVAQRNGQPETAAYLSRRAGSLPRPFDWPDPVLRDIQRLRTDRAALADQANALLQQQRTREAEGILNRLLVAFPEDAEALLLLGRLHYLERRCSEAESAFRRHLAVQKNSLNGLIQLGLSMLCQERWNDAILVLEQAIVLKPDFAQAHHNLGVARSRAGDSAGAVRAYRDALRCNPGDVGAHVALAEELIRAGQHAEAAGHLQRASALEPSDPRVQELRERLRSR